MQGAYLTITVGIQFFILVGYLFHLVFRTYSEAEDKISLMSWTTRLVGFLTFWLLLSVLLVLTRMTLADIVLAGGLLIADILGIYLLVDDTRRSANQV